MSTRSLVAGLVVALQWAGALSVAAADMYSPYEGPRAEAPDDDPRYGDVYKLPPPPRQDWGPRYGEHYDPPPPPPRFAERYAPIYPEPRPFIDRREYLPPLPHPPGFYGPGRRAYDEGGCVPRYEIKRALTSDGWGNFQDLEVRDDVALVRARRPNGELYDIKIDRCTGRLLRAEAVRGEPGSYAWRNRGPYPAY